MASTNRVDRFFAASKDVRMVSPAVDTKIIDFARRHAESRGLERANTFLSESKNLRVIVPAAMNNGLNNAKKFAESINAQIAIGMGRTPGAQNAIGRSATTNPYAAGRASGNSSAAIKPAEKTTADSLAKRRGRSL